MSKSSCAVAALVGVVGAGGAFASGIHLGSKPFVVNDTILRVTPQAGEPDFDGASTVDHWFVTVDTAGQYYFNLLSWEVFFTDERGGDIGTAVDVNGDGEIAFIDTHIRLFDNDGDLSLDDEIAENDDDFDSAAASADGSIYGYDSYLRLFLAPGEYILAVGAYHMSPEDAVEGFDESNNFYPVSWSDDLQDYLPADHGDYQLAMALVPTPGAAALMALAGLAGLRRRR